MFTGIVQSKSKKKKIIKKNFGAELSVDVENGFTNNLKKAFQLYHRKAFPLLPK